MTVQLSAFLFIYALFLLVWAALSIVAFYHISKYGFKCKTTYIVSFVFIATAAAMLLISIYFIAKIDWSVGFDILEGLFSSRPVYN